MIRFVARTIVYVFLAVSIALCKDVTIHGFVTAVNSPTSFAIDDYRIDCNKTVAIDLKEMDKALGTFQLKDIRIGTELEVLGEYDDASGELRAKSIKVFSYDTLVVKRTALLEKLPSLTKIGSGWLGVIYADGQRITVSTTTRVSLKPNHLERNAGKDKDSETLEFSPDAVNLDTFVRYEGVRQSDGSIQAKKVEFEHAEIEGGEAKMWERFAPKVSAPDYSSFQPGQLKMHWKTYKIIPSQQAQDYIAKLGSSLIPAHQEELPIGDPLKIPFRFFLVEDRSFNAVTYPNGVVVVHSGVFDVLQNESQLAFVLAHEISHAVEKHAWQQHQYYRNELIALRAGGAFVPGGLLLGNLLASGISSQYARTLENQADRVGLEWMFAAGYDVREAPQSWKAVSEKKGDSTTNPFWSSHDNFTARRSYLMAELRNNYSDVDYSNLKKDSAEFHEVADLVRTFEKNKRRKVGKAAE